MYFWAKTTEDGQPGISVRGHCFNVACVARVLAENNAAQLARWGLTPDMVAFLAGAHDCGKISYDFQKKCRQWDQNWKQFHNKNRETGMRHGEHSMLAIIRFLLANEITDSESATLWGEASGAHHGTLFEKIDLEPDDVPNIEDQDKCFNWENFRIELLTKLEKHFEITKLPSVTVKSPEIWYVAGLISLADWIASDENFFAAGRENQENICPTNSPEEVSLVQKIKNILNQLGLNTLTIRKDCSFEDVFHFPPNAFQKKAMEMVSEPGLYIFEAPMGMGKTEAALWAAWKLIAQNRATGIYFALPTQITSNRIWLRMQSFANAICPTALPPRIIHSNAWMLQENPFGRTAHAGTRFSLENFAAERWFNSGKKALFAPLGVGTIDQALMAVLAVKHFFMRRYALASKVVILDEVHSYDAYTGTLVKQLCHELVALGSTVIVLSATLTERKRLEILKETSGGISVDAPIRLTAKPCNSVSSVCVPMEVPSQREVQIFREEREPLMTRMEKLALQGASVLWICDTVNAAQKTCHEFLSRGLLQEGDIGLLHSRYPLFQRDINEEHWLGRLGKNGTRDTGCILVATQVVEQSVDIDADILVTELAPTDMLLQRMGRLQRHNRGPRPWPAQCWIIAEPMTSGESRTMSPEAIEKNFGPKSRVYWPDILLRSLEVWEKRKTVALPEDIRPLLEETYAEKQLPQSWQKLENDRLGDEYAKQLQAAMGTNKWNMTQNDFDDPYEIATPTTRINEFLADEVVLCSGYTKTGFVLLEQQNAEPIVIDGTAPFSRTNLVAIAGRTVRLPRYRLEKHFINKKGTSGILNIKQIKSFWDKDKTAILRMAYGRKEYYFALVSSENDYLLYSSKLGVAFNETGKQR